MELRRISGLSLPTFQTASPSRSARLWHDKRHGRPEDRIGSGFPQPALSRWEAEAGMSEAGSYFQLSLLNHLSASLKPECLCRGREKA